MFMEEFLDIVTEDDIVTHQALRSVVHARGLWHRGVHVFLVDNGGRLLVQKRSADRTIAPSALDCSVSEHVKAGESYLEAARRGLAVRFDEGSMTSLPYDAAAFDVVLCLWTAFYELTQQDEQVAALGEMHRVLAPGGIAIVEGPTYEDSLALQGDRGARPGAGQRIVGSMVGGHRMEHFAHDATSLERVAGLAGISRREVVVRDWAGRRRQLLLFRG